MKYDPLANVKEPKDTKAVGNVEAIKCFFGPDREVDTKELMSFKKAHDTNELAADICAVMGWTHVPYQPKPSAKAQQ